MSIEDLVDKTKQRIVQAGEDHPDMHDAAIGAALQMEMEGAKPPVSSKALILMKLTTIHRAKTPRHARHRTQPNPPTP